MSIDIREVKKVMPLIELKCPSCGGELDIGTTGKDWKCSYCGNSYNWKDIINNYYVNVTNQYIDGTGSSGALTSEMRMRLNAAEATLKLGKYEDALIRFRDLCDEIPQDYRVWWGQIRAMTEDFTIPVENQEDLINLHDLYNAMVLFLPEQKRSPIENRFTDYVRLQQQNMDLRRAELISRSECLREESDELLEAMEQARQSITFRAAEIRAFREWLLGIILIVALLAGSVLLFLLALLGCILYLGVIEPELMQMAGEKEKQAKKDIGRYSERLHNIEQELRRIEEQLSELAD